MNTSAGDVQTVSSGLVRTRYFKFFFAIGCAIFVALFLGFYSLIFQSITNALNVQSSFFVERVAEHVQGESLRIKRETGVLSSNRVVKKWLLNAGIEDARYITRSKFVLNSSLTGGLPALTILFIILLPTLIVPGPLFWSTRFPRRWP